MLEWRKGYPSEEMIAAHQSRWWLVKDNWLRIKKIFPLSERIEHDQLEIIVGQRYFVSESGEITLLENPDFGGDITRGEYVVSFYENEYVEIHYEGYDKFYNLRTDLDFKGQWNGRCVKEIENRHSSVDCRSHAETVLKLLQEQGKLKQTENQRRYAEDYFCPIDEDGNKVPWPKEIIVGTIDDASMYDAADPAGSLVVATVHIGE